MLTNVPVASLPIAASGAAIIGADAAILGNFALHPAVIDSYSIAPTDPPIYGAFPFSMAMASGSSSSAGSSSFGGAQSISGGGRGDGRGNLGGPVFSQSIKAVRFMLRRLFEGMDPLILEVEALFLQSFGLVRITDEHTFKLARFVSTEMESIRERIDQSKRSLYVANIQLKVMKDLYGPFLHKCMSFIVHFGTSGLQQEQKRLANVEDKIAALSTSITMLEKVYSEVKATARKYQPYPVVDAKGKVYLALTKDGADMLELLDKMERVIDDIPFSIFVEAMNRVTPEESSPMGSASA